jgi:D-aminopeptidase
MGRARLRDLGIVIGTLPTGPHNAITDVPGVRVGHATLIADQPRIARTGVTVIQPRPSDPWANPCFAGYFSFNGNGEMTGLPWIDESGLLTSPIGLTNTHQVGLVRDALIRYEIAHGTGTGWVLPVVAETWDGWLNDINAFHLTEAHVFAALADASGGPVAEGNVGGGTGMICHGFKGGIGTASRVVSIYDEPYTVGALVQANYGRRDGLRIDGVPVGRLIDETHTPGLVEADASPAGEPSGSSIIVVIATDAPLLPDQCRRLARRATVGLARVGGVGYDSSGDLFLAFSTGNDIPVQPPALPTLRSVPHERINPLFDAVAEATEEAILNALTAAETMQGFKGRIIHALPLDALTAILRARTP